MSEYEKALRVISKPPEKRLHSEINQLVPWMRSKAKLFKSLRADILADIIRHCCYLTKERDEIVIKQGDVGECFYITLNGKVSIYILNKEQMMDSEDDEGEADLSNIIQYNEDGHLIREKMGYFVTSLGGGAPFGDVALTSGDSIRTASIVADERTDLLVVDRALYNRSMKEVLAKEFLEKTTFIKTNPLFARWPAKYKKQLAMALYKESFGYESTLTRQGDATSDMFFILRGQVEIQMDTGQHAQQYPQIFRAAKENVDSSSRKVETPRKHNERTRHSNTHTHSNGSIIRRTRLCHLGVNECVGDVELTMDLPTYMQTAVCRETTEVLVLEAKHYDRLFVRRHPRTIEVMRDQIGVKLESRLSMTQNKADIPFLSYLQRIIELRHKPSTLQDRDKDEPTVSMAEKEFLNHKGPLIDIHGPGSVFYLIKLRERTRMRMRAKRLDRIERPMHSTAHTVPHNVLMAAANEIDQLPDEDTAYRRPQSALGPNAHLQQARSFRNIRSATQRRGEAADRDYDDEGETRNKMYSRMSSTWPESEGPEEHDARLSYLEEKVRRWLHEDNPKGRPQVAQLRRLPVDDIDFNPRPGNRVYVRRKGNQPTTSSGSPTTNTSTKSSKYNSSTTTSNSSNSEVGSFKHPSFRRPDAASSVAYNMLSTH